MNQSMLLSSYHRMVRLYEDSYIKSNNDSLQPVASIVVSIRSIMGVTQPSWVWHNKEPLYSEHCPFKLCLSVRLLRTLPLFYEHFRRCSYGLVRPSTPTATQGWKEQDNKSKLPLNTVYLSQAEGTGKRRGFKPSIWSSLMCVDSSCTKGLKQSLAVMSGWIPFPKYRYMHPCDSWKEKKNNGPICVYSLGKGTVCEIYANKRYCFARKINLARFPSVYCKRRYLKANLLWMNRTKALCACLTWV